MFLDLLKRRNPSLLEVAAQLHKAGQLPPNTYVIDLDYVERNAGHLRAEAERLSLTPFAMVKQIGRNPDASATIARAGITHSVGVDLECTIAAATGGLRSGHIGHLVQIPRHQAAIAASLEPSYWTVFSLDKAREAAEASAAVGRTQNILVRIFADGDRFYRGHEGGVPVEGILRIADQIDALEGARFAGITSFPATLFDAASGTVATTPNFATLTRAAELLRAEGRSDVELNAPGTTSTAMLQRLADGGATQVEPGHGLTGTTPWHAVQDLVEEPAIAYISEVSHLWNDQAFVFGGGLYVDPVLDGQQTSAVVVTGADVDVAHADTFHVDMPAANAIDYYASIPLQKGHGVRTGDTVIFGFRPQVFVSRGLTAGISGISTGTPRIEGIWSANGAAPITAGSVQARNHTKGEVA